MNYKITILFPILFFCYLTSFSQTGYSTFIVQKGVDYGEATDPHPVNETSWKNIPVDVMVRFGSADIRYAKRSAPAIKDVSTQWRATAWKGEKVHTQVLVYTKTPIKSLRITAGVLKDGKG